MQIEEYISYISGVRRYSRRTQDIYRDVLKSFEGSEYTLDSTGIRNYEVYLMKKDFSARTVNLHLSVLSGYCKYLCKQGLLKSNPVRQVRRPKEEKRIPVFFRRDAMDRYYALTDCDTDQDNLEFLLSLPPSDNTARALYDRRLRRLIVSALYGTGMRRSELISLNMASLDHERRVLSVLGKGDKMREIPLVGSLYDEILLYLSAADHMLGQDGNAGTPLFRTVKGARLYPSYVERAVKEALGNADGFTGKKSPHVLRHTIASELLDEGTDLNSIKELLGHSSLAATQVYTHSTVERLKKVYNSAHPRAIKNGGNNGDQD